MSEETSHTPDGKHADETKNVFFSVPGAAQSLGNAVLQRFNAIIPRPDTERRLTPIEELVREQNEYIDMRKHAHLTTNLFRAQPEEVELSRVNSLMNTYRSELEERHTLADRYALFMDERFTDYVYTLDLAETKQAGSHEEIEKLKAEYVELRDRLVSRGTIDGELDRSDKTSQFLFSTMKHELYVTGMRNRKLFCFERDGRKITVAKRMDFLISRSEISDIELSSGHIELTKKHKIQKLIDTQDEVIVPVRTVYFATNQEAKEPK